MATLAQTVVDRRAWAVRAPSPRNIPAPQTHWTTLGRATGVRRGPARDLAAAPVRIHRSAWTRDPLPHRVDIPQPCRRHPNRRRGPSPTGRLADCTTPLRGARSPRRVRNGDLGDGRNTACKAVASSAAPRYEAQTDGVDRGPSRARGSDHLCRRSQTRTADSRRGRHGVDKAHDVRFDRIRAIAAPLHLPVGRVSRNRYESVGSAGPLWFPPTDALLGFGKLGRPHPWAVRGDRLFAGSPTQP